MNKPAMWKQVGDGYIGLSATGAITGVIRCLDDTLLGRREKRLYEAYRSLKRE